MAAFGAINIQLRERFIHGRAREIIRAVCGTMFNEETPAFKAAFVLVEEFMFGVKKLWALFVRGGIFVVEAKGVV
jgi:hypothetical protein